MPPDTLPRNITRHARKTMAIGAGINAGAVKDSAKRRGKGEEPLADKVLCWCAYYTLVFAALCAFLPMETGIALAHTAAVVDQVGGFIGSAGNTTMQLRGTLH